MADKLETQLVQIVRQHTDQSPVRIEIPLIRIDENVHPCGITLTLNGFPKVQPLTVAEKQRLVHVAQSIWTGSAEALTIADLALFPRAGYDLRCENLMAVIEDILRKERPVDDHCRDSASENAK